MSKPGTPRLRCAIYTRKSSEEGLEQGYNSLDAQRDACAAYVRSQKHEGWTLIPDAYDDGGVSGGTIDRPALKQLFRDIEAKKVDIIVVYKVDRLTRSLSDFVKMVELFERANVSFVSITQQFNTATSMGRLTLNMLLSFAQFEREVTGERIRDKIAASKKKGMWMGGNPSLGYDVHDRHLVVNDAEAATVRHIYRRYVELKSVRLLKEELDADGIVSKSRADRDGNQRGGRPMMRGALYLLLQNPIYRGRIVHKGTSYPGEHAAIIDDDLWDTVQRELAENRVDRKLGTQSKVPSLLAGLVYDAKGERMSPSHAAKNGRRYRYYISQSLIKNSRGTAPEALRVAADEIERAVGDRLTAFLTDPASLHETFGASVSDAGGQKKLILEASRLAGKWPTLSVPEKRGFLVSAHARITLGPGSIELRLDAGRIRSLLLGELLGEIRDREHVESAHPISLSATFDGAWTGAAAKLLIETGNGGRRRGPDPSLVKLLAQAHRYNAVFVQGGKSVAEMAREMGVTRSYFTRVLRLSFLAPPILRAIVLGRQPASVSASTLTADTRFPILWKDQLAQLGFA